MARDAQGQPYAVRYDAVNAMLLNEFLKEHRKVEEQEKRINALIGLVGEQAAQLKEISDRIDALTAARPVPMDWTETVR